MNIKTLKVFYGGDFLPYKDKEREVHYPNVGSDFQGAESITNIRFYISEIASNNTTFAVAIELPNGKIGSKVLAPTQYDSELGEYYVTLGIDRFITQKAGNVSISLRGYQGDIQLEYDEVTQLYVLVGGTPVTAVTGSIKLRVNQEPQALQGDLDEEVTLQEVLALLSTKLNITDGIFVVQDITQANISDLENGQLIYSKNTDSVYKRNTSAQSGYEKLYDIASKSWVVSNYVPYTGATGNVDLSGHYLYNAEVDTDYNGDNHDTYKSNDYKQISNVAFVLKQNTEIESNKINLDMYEYFLNENATLLCGGLLYRKLTETPSDLIYACLNASITTITDGTSVTLGRVISISKTAVDGVHFYTESDLTIELYSKSQAKAKFGTSLALELNNTNYKLVAKLYNANGGLISTSNEIDLPLESIVSSATYYDTYTYDGVTYTKVIVITLSTTSVPTIVPVGDLISGLEKEACVEVEASSSSGTFTEEEIQTLALDNASIKCGGRIFHKVTNTNFSSIDVTIGQGLNLVVSNAISITTSTRAWELVTKVIQVYNKEEIDTIVQGLQDDIDANAHDIDTLDGDITDIQGDIDDIDERLDNHDTEIAKMKKDIDYAMKYPLIYGTPTTDTEEEVGLTTSQLPATTLPKGLINYVGGSSVVINQLVSGYAPTDTYAGITFTNEGNGEFTVSGTATARVSQRLNSTTEDVKTDHKYLICGMEANTQNIGLIFNGYNGSTYVTTYQQKDIGSGAIIDNSNADVSKLSVECVIDNGTALSKDYSIRPRVADLTQMFGAGNEPTSTSDPRIQWLIDFLEQHPEYDEGSFVHAGLSEVLSLDSKGSEANWFLGNLKKTARVDMGTLTWAYDNGKFRASMPSNCVAVVLQGDGNPHGLCADYENVYDRPVAIYNNELDKAFIYNSYYFSGDKEIFIRDTAYNDAQAFKTAMSGKYLVYELETPTATPTLTPTDILNSIGAEYTAYPIPNEVKSLDGYGLGLSDTLYNYIDFENKKFVKKVGIVDLGTLEWSITGNVFYSSDLRSLAKKPTYNTDTAKAICSKYQVVSRTLLAEGTLCIDPDGDIDVIDGTYADEVAFKTAMSGVYLVYELAEPVETDISEYIDRDFPNENLIDLYQGGEVEFENQNDMAVPYSLTYQYKVE